MHAWTYPDCVSRRIALTAQSRGMLSVGWAWVGIDESIERAVQTVAIGPEEKYRITSALQNWLYLNTVKSQHPQLLEFYQQVKDYGAKYFNISYNTAPEQSLFATSLYNAVHTYLCAQTFSLSLSLSLALALSLSLTLSLSLSGRRAWHDTA